MAELLARDFVYERHHFDRARRLLGALAGLQLSDAKRELVYNRLTRRMRERRCTDFDRYLDSVEANVDEQRAFVNALTTNLTGFYREAHHMDVIANLAVTWSQKRPMRIWSAAASTGEEPYSIAMAIASAVPSLPFEILATDIDSDVLARAERGTYEDERLRTLPAGFKERFFLRGSGAKAGLVRVRSELRDRVRFLQMNLLDARWPAVGSFDAIFCRNVLIYFERQAQRSVVARLHEHLAEGGVLCTGHAESLFYASDLFEVAGRTTYRRAA